MSAVREGHRPLLSPAQAAALARKLFGVHCDPETCKELPSYDDRNFLIKACASHSAEQQTPCVHGTAAPASAEPMRWVLKVHNTRDTHRHAYFQAIDAAMLRLAAAGVLTNTPVPPTAADAAHGPAVSSALGAGTDAAGHPRAAAGAEAGAAASAMCEQQPTATAAGVPGPHSECTPAGQGGSVEGKEGSPPDAKGGASQACLPTCGVDRWPATGPAWEGGDSAQAVASTDAGTGARGEGRQPQEGAAFRLAWALLPCSCHPPPLTHTSGCQVAGATAPSSIQDSSNDLTGRRQQQGQHQVPSQQEGEWQGAGQDQPQEDQRPPHPVLHRAVVRCLTFVPGRTLSTVGVVTPAVLRSLGATMGVVTAALAGWRPQGLGGGEGGEGNLSDWHVDRAAAVVERLVPGIGPFSAQQRSQLLAVAAELRSIFPRLAALPRQVCHADANDDNVLVSDDSSRVTGVIDFGDMAVMPRVCELSITLLYAMLLLLQRPPLGTAPPPPGTNQQQQQQDAQQQLGHGEQQGQAGHMPGTAASGAGGPEGCSAMAVGEESGLVAGDRAVLEHVLGQLQHTVAGYLSHVPLSGAELSLLPLLLRARLAQSLTMGAASVAADPGNAEYLLATQRPGWVAMRLLQPGRLMGDEEVVRRLVGGP